MLSLQPGKNPAEEPAKEDSNASSPGGTATAVFNDDITIYTGHRLNHLDQGAIKAYAAQGKGKAPARLFVLVCEPDLTPRSIKAANYASIINPALARLVERHPLIDVELHQESSGEVLEQLRAGELDAGFYFGDALGNPGSLITFFLRNRISKV